MPELLISIVVPTYNRAHLLPATLSSLQAQKNRNFEIIIVDDGSTDNTEDVVMPFLNDFTRYFKKTNEERAAARNYGASLAKGKYLNFFDSDDLALSNHLSEAAIVIEKYDNPEWFHLSYEWINKKGEAIKKINNRVGKIINRSLCNGNNLGCNGVFVRNDIFFENPFNEARILSASEDYELWLRLAARYPLYYSNVITSQLIDHDNRSVRLSSGNDLIARLEFLITCVQANTEVKKYFGAAVKKIISECYSYISLHLSAFGDWKLISLKYYVKGFFSSPFLVFRKRSFVIFRNLLFHWIR